MLGHCHSLTLLPTRIPKQKHDQDLWGTVQRHLRLGRHHLLVGYHPGHDVSLAEAM